MDFIDGHKVENRKGDSRKKLYTLIGPLNLMKWAWKVLEEI